jgi:hypothetical protein
MPELELKGSLADLQGELAKARIVDAAVRHLNELGPEAAGFEFGLSFGLSW